MLDDEMIISNKPYRLDTTTVIFREEEMARKPYINGISDSQLSYKGIGFDKMTPYSMDFGD